MSSSIKVKSVSNPIFGVKDIAPIYYKNGGIILQKIKNGIYGDKVANFDSSKIDVLPIAFVNSDDSTKCVIYISETNKHTIIFEKNELCYKLCNIFYWLNFNTERIPEWKNISDYNPDVLIVYNSKTEKGYLNISPIKIPKDEENKKLINPPQLVRVTSQPNIDVAKIMLEYSKKSLSKNYIPRLLPREQPLGNFTTTNRGYKRYREEDYDWSNSSKFSRN